MNDRDADLIEKKCPDIIIISSETKGLKYLFDGCKDRVAIAGYKGKVLLTINQAKTLCKEFEEILSMRGYITERKLEK